MTAEVAGPGVPDDAEGAILLVLVGVPMLVASGLVSGIIVAASPDKVYRRELPAEYSQPRRCPKRVGNMNVTLHLPSGRRITAATNRKGWVRFEVPAGEPEAGTVTALAGGKPMTTLRYGPVGQRITSGEIRAALDSVSFELDHCGRTFGVEGTMQISMVFDRGLAKLHQPHDLPAMFAQCINDALGKAKLRSARRYLWRNYPLRFDRSPAARPTSRPTDGCEPYIDEWRAEKEAVAKGKLILAMPDRCRRPEYLRPR
jgi:hypothetical protein